MGLFLEVRQLPTPTTISLILSSDTQDTQQHSSKVKGSKVLKFKKILFIFWNTFKLRENCKDSAVSSQIFHTQWLLLIAF